MFKIPTEAPAWTSDQAAALRQFLNGASGQTFLQRMFWERPEVSPPAVGGFDPAQRAACAEQLLGYERALQTILALTESPKP